MLKAILNKSWRQHPTRHQLYGHLPLITKTIKVRRTRHAVHCVSGSSNFYSWRSKDELINDVLQWTPAYGQAKAGRPDRTYIQQLCEDTGCSPEDLPKAMNDRENWRERVRDIRASGMTWWWWWLLPSFVVFRFSLLAWYIFLYPISSYISSLYISLLVLGFPILFHFWQTVWYRLCRFGGWFFLAISKTLIS